jgi:hypothetical protein
MIIINLRTCGLCMRVCTSVKTNVYVYEYIISIYVAYVCECAKNVYMYVG